MSLKGLRIDTPEEDGDANDVTVASHVDIFWFGSRIEIRNAQEGGGGQKEKQLQLVCAPLKEFRVGVVAPTRERGPHTCKRTFLKGRAEPKNRSLKCNDIVVFNARLFKTGPFVFLEHGRYFTRY